MYGIIDVSHCVPRVAAIHVHNNAYGPLMDLTNYMCVCVCVLLMAHLSHYRLSRPNVQHWHAHIHKAIPLAFEVCLVPIFT